MRAEFFFDQKAFSRSRNFATGDANRRTGRRLGRQPIGLETICAPRGAAPGMREHMVNPMEIMPVLALAFMIVCIPILGDRP
jgi:hypothetical protein